VDAAMTGGENLGKQVGNIWRAGLQEFIPVDLTAGPGAIGLPLPTVMQLPIQIATNRDWKNDLIYPPKYNARTPDSELYFADVNPIAKRIARGLNAATGGSRTKPGFIDFSPESLEHIIEFVASGPGKFAEKASESVQALAEGRLPEAHEVPVTRRFFKTRSPFRSNEAFGEKLTELERVHDAELDRDEDAEPSAALTAARRAKREAQDLRKKADAETNFERKQALLKQADRVLQSFLRAPGAGSSGTRTRSRSTTDFRSTSGGSTGFR